MKTYPLVSLILPIRNESRYIERCLDAVLNQDYPPDSMEILVVDGMSTDGTWDIVQRLVSDRPNVKLIENSARIVSRALNLALQNARGEIIVRVDGHTIIEPDYVSRCVTTLQKTGADNVGGKMSAIGESFFGEVVAIATGSPFGVGGAKFHYSDQTEWVDTVYMGAWRRELFGKTGLFDEELVRNQDDEYNYRIRKLGGKILLSPKIRSRYYNRGSLGKLWKQYFEYGFWKVRVLQKHPCQMRPRQFIPPLFVLALLLSGMIAFLSALETPFSLTGLPIIFLRLQFPLLCFLYLFVNLVFSLRETARRGWRYFPLLPLVYATLHVAYGMGFLTGLARFARRWGDTQGRVPNLHGYYF